MSREYTKQSGSKQVVVLPADQSSLPRRHTLSGEWQAADRHAPEVHTYRKTGFHSGFYEPEAAEQKSSRTQRARQLYQQLELNSDLPVNAHIDLFV